MKIKVKRKTENEYGMGLKEVWTYSSFDTSLEVKVIKTGDIIGTESMEFEDAPAEILEQLLDEVEDRAANIDEARRRFESGLEGTDDE